MAAPALVDSLARCWNDIDDELMLLLNSTKEFRLQGKLIETQGITETLRTPVKNPSAG
jgi:hypothetical protein